MVKKLFSFLNDRENCRRIISLFYSFILSLSLLMFVICRVIWSGLFSDNYFFNVLDNGYYDVVYKDIVTSAEDYTIPAEFDISVINGVFDAEQVRIDIDNCAKAALSGNSFSPYLTALNSMLYANVEKCIENGTVELDKNSDKDSIINAYVNEIDKIYTDRISITGIRILAVARSGYKKWAVIGLVATLLLSAAMIFMLTRLNRQISKSLSYIAYGAGGFSLMSFFIPFILYHSEFYNAIRIPDQALFNLVSNYIKCILMSFIHYSLLGMIATLMLIAAAVLTETNDRLSLLKKTCADIFKGKK